jgi:hypothetical protein
MEILRTISGVDRIIKRALLRITGSLGTFEIKIIEIIDNKSFILPVPVFIFQKKNYKTLGAIIEFNFSLNQGGAL